MPSRWMIRGLLASLALAPLLGCEPAVPASPSYEADVLPIFKAHCLRCHGDASPDGGPYNDAQTKNLAGVAFVNLGVYASTVSMAQQPAATGGKSILYDVIHGAPATGYVMPVPPAAALDDYELKVMDAWIANPVCSHAAKPDPSICPPDGGT